MVRSPCCDIAHINKGSWTKEEDQRLVNYIRDHGAGCWRSLPKAAGLQRCGKSCRLRWLNYLRPGLKRGNFSQEEDAIIINLHSLIGNKWSVMAQRLPGRTDNEIKNHWNIHLKHKLISHGIDPQTHRRISGPNTAPVPADANMKAKDICDIDSICTSGTTIETQAPQEIENMVDDPMDLNLELTLGRPIPTKPSPFFGVAPLLQMFPAATAINPLVKRQGLCLCWQLGFQNDQLCLECQMRTGYKQNPGS